jgi:hypothetical protein
MALLELMREGLIEIVQTAPLEPLHVRRASGQSPEADDQVAAEVAAGDAARQAEEAMLAAAVEAAAHDEPDEDDAPGATDTTLP